MFLFGTVMNNKVTVTGIINRTESPPRKNNEWSIIIYTLKQKGNLRIMKWKEIINESAWVVDDIISKEECEYLLKMASDLGIHGKRASGDVRHRNSMTVELDDEELAQTLYDRIKMHIPQEVWIDESCTNLGLSYDTKQLYGKWTSYGINSKFRIVCYPGQGHFGPHRDGARIVDEHHRSLITINGFLTNRPSGFGGATRFVRDRIDLGLNDDGIFSTSDSDVLHRVEAEKAGTASVFFHDLMHDGEPLKEGSPEKWLFRTEIMYEREPDSAPQLTKSERDAKGYLQQAELAECSGDILEATKFYKMAYRLDPSLDGSF